jgi:hypothetical protein
MPSLSFTVVDAGIMVGGKTFNVKDRLKEVGGRWNPQTSSWSIPVAADSPALRDELEKLATKKKADEAAAAKAVRVYAASPEGKAAAAADEKKRIKAEFAAGSSWLCCENCTVIDWVRKHTSCQACAVDGNSFRVRGSIYTGD